MATTKRTLKKVRQQAVVKILASAGGSNTISLAELAYPDETFNAANANVTITGIVYASDVQLVVSRGGANVLVLPAGQDDWNFAQMYGYVLDDNSNANILIDFGATGNGSCMVIMSKKTGYTPPNRQELKDYER